MPSKRNRKRGDDLVLEKQRRSRGHRADLLSAETLLRMRMEVLSRMEAAGVVVLMLSLHHMCLSSAQVSPGDIKTSLESSVFLQRHSEVHNSSV